MKKLISVLLSVLIFSIARAASPHGDDHIPFKEIGFQVINLGVLLVIIFFAVRKSIVELFKTRYAAYNEQAQKTAEAKAAAELALADIKARIQNLQSSEDHAIAKAHADAAALKSKVIQEAKTQAEKIKADTHLIVGAELNNAKNQIREEIINSSMELAKNTIKNSAETVSKKSEKRFLQEISNTKAQVSL